MTTMPVMPRKGDWTVEDLDRIPDDGLQYELADGVLLVTPPPLIRHQRALGNLYLLIRPAVPPDMEVFFSPVDFRPTNRRSLQPDLLVVRREDVEEKNITRPLLLAVEALSPSTRSKDLLLKRGLYEDSGIANYWMLDPGPADPSLLVLEMDGGRYAEVASVHGDEVFSAERPFPVDVCPGRLSDG